MRAFIDTNILIYALELHPQYSEEAGEILGAIDTGKLTAVTSSLVLLEVSWYLESKKRLPEMQEAFNLIYESKIQIHEVNLQDIKEAITSKTKHPNIDLNDLINYHLMKRLEIKNIYTNDSHFDKLPGLQSHFNKHN